MSSGKQPTNIYVVYTVTGCIRDLGLSEGAKGMWAVNCTRKNAKLSIVLLGAFFKASLSGNITSLIPYSQTSFFFSPFSFSA